MSWMLMVAATWALLSLPVVLLVGRMMRLGDAREASQSQVAVPDFVPAEWTRPSAGFR